MFQTYSSRKKAVLAAIKKCERYGFVEPELKKRMFIYDYQGTLLGSIRKIPVN